MAIDERQLFEAAELDMSPDFRRQLERDLLAAASAGAEPTHAAPTGAPEMEGALSRRRAWVTASAAALLIAAIAGVTAIRLHRDPSVDNVSKPTTATTTTVASTSTTSTTVPRDTTPAPPSEPGLRGGDLHVVASITDIHAIDLDRYLAGGPSWSDTDVGGPYLVFDLAQLPPEWNVMSVEGSHPLADLVATGGTASMGYLWKAQLSTGSIEATLTVESSDFSFLGQPATIRGRGGFESTDNFLETLSWLEQDGVKVTLSSVSGSALPTLRALAESLQETSDDSMGPQPPWPPPNGGISFDVGAPELSGTISGHQWTVDTSDETVSRSLFPRVDQVLLGGLATTHPDYPNNYGMAITAVIGGVMVLAVLPTEADHAHVQLSDGSTVDISGYHWADRVGFVVPIPHGLDVTDIDFETADGTSLQHLDIPEYPPVVSGTYTLPYDGEPPTPATI